MSKMQFLVSPKRSRSSQSAETVPVGEAPVAAAPLNPIPKNLITKPLDREEVTMTELGMLSNEDWCKKRVELYQQDGQDYWYYEDGPICGIGKGKQEGAVHAKEAR